MLHILMGRAGSGKSARVLRELARLGDTSRQILLVPEHASHMAEVDVCRACGDSAGRHAEVLTFKLLATRVLSIVGGAADVTLDNGGKLLTMQRTLQELAPYLTVYRRPSARAAFLESLLALMEELQAYAVTPETLSERVAQLTGESGDKLRDVALLYGQYLTNLCADGRDARDRLEKLEEGLAASGYADGKDVFLDGFSYFTGRELNILRILLRRARSVTVTLLGDGSALFAESLRMRGQLERLAADVGTPCETELLPLGEADTALAHIERNFFTGGSAWTGESGTVQLCEAGTALHEVEWVASEIMRLVRTQGLRWRDITVAARVLDDYEPTVRTVFARWGIPLYCSRRADILCEPVVTLLLGALDAVCGGFSYEEMFRCLKTTLAGLTAEECDVLENYVLKWSIHGTMWVRENDWTAHPEGYGVEWRDEHRAQLARVNAARRTVQRSFAPLYEGLKGESSARSKVDSLYRWLERIGLPDTLEQQTQQCFRAGDVQRAEELAQLWNILCGVFDQFVSILGDKLLGAEEFARLMRLVLTQYSVGTIPAALDRVSLCELTRNDRHTVGALFLLGANDTVLPAPGTPSGILKDEDRMALEALDICLAPYGTAQFSLEIQNIYAALAQPARMLTVSYPRLDASGAELRPSFVVGRIASLCPQARFVREDGDRSYRLASRTAALEYAGEQPDGAAWQYFARDTANAPVLAAMHAAAQYTRGSLSRAAVRTLYGERVTLSASRLDKARSCHFAYFMRYGLRAKERTTASFDAPMTGSFVHDVLDHTLRAARGHGGLKALSREQLHALAREAVDEYVRAELGDLEEKPARFRYLFRRLCESVYRMLDDVVDELRVSDFEPLAFELAFGEDGQLPAITIREGGGELALVGKVDRVDGWVHEGRLYLRVVDYKTGRKSFDLAEIRYGLGLQLLLYLDALEQKGEALFGREIVPAGVLYTPVREPLLSLPRDIAPEKLREAMQKQLRRSGMLLGDPAVLQAMEHDALREPCYLPVTVKRGKDGAVSLGESVTSLERLGRLGKYAELQLRSVARELREGDIDADPYARSEQETYCRFCEFAPACHFENGRGRDRIEYIRATKAEEFWQHIDAAVEGGDSHG